MGHGTHRIGKHGTEKTQGMEGTYGKEDPSVPGSMANQNFRHA